MPPAAPTKDRPAAPWLIGIDVGGTFTDLALVDANGALWTHKALSRPEHPADGVFGALGGLADALDLSLKEVVGGARRVVHGLTVGTNTLLQQSGAVTGLLTTEGFRDALELRRGIRKKPWDHRTPYPLVLVPRYLRLPVAERIDRHGRVFEPLDETSIHRAVEVFRAEAVESVAICFLNSYLNPAHERQAADLLRELMPNIWVSVSSEIAPIAGEYERQSTAVVDAYVAPRLADYLKELDARLSENGLRSPLLLVKNNGGTGVVDEVSRTPVNLTLSGPAAIVGGLVRFADALGTDDLISLEVGGTSTDVALMHGGVVDTSDRLSISDYDMAIPSIEIHTVGAGGGTIAGTHLGGALFVGPAGAGADPGPACYGLGGKRPTITDAQLVLGRLRAGKYACGALALDPDLARAAIESEVAGPLGLGVEEAAAGMVRVLEQRMLHAVQYLSVQRGLDPRRFVLLAGGGAGAMHACEVARLLGSRRVYVPRVAGVLCAFGMLNADVRQDYVRSHAGPLDDTAVAPISDVFAGLRDLGAQALARQGFEAPEMTFRYGLDLRYGGQQWNVRVELTDSTIDIGEVRKRFEAEYQRLFGHVQPDAPVETVKLRMTASGRVDGCPTSRLAKADGDAAPADHREVYVDAEQGRRSLPIFDGAKLTFGHAVTGPAIIEEATTTVLIGPGDRLRVDETGNYLIDLQPAEAVRDAA